MYIYIYIYVYTYIYIYIYIYKYTHIIHTCYFKHTHPYIYTHKVLPIVVNYSSHLVTQEALSAIF